MSIEELSLISLLCLLRVSRRSHSSSSPSLSLSKVTRSLAGERRDEATLSTLRFRSVLRSSEEERKGLLLLCRPNEGLLEDRGNGLAREEDEAPSGLVDGLGVGLGGAATFSTRILGGSPLNLFARPRSGMAETCLARSFGRVA